MTIYALVGVDMVPWEQLESGSQVPEESPQPWLGCLPNDFVGDKGALQLQTRGNNLPALRKIHPDRRNNIQALRNKRMMRIKSNKLEEL